MKKNIFFILQIILITLVFVGCSKKEEVTSKPEVIEYEKHESRITDYTDKQYGKSIPEWVSKAFSGDELSREYMNSIFPEIKESLVFLVEGIGGTLDEAFDKATEELRENTMSSFINLLTENGYIGEDADYSRMADAYNENIGNNINLTGQFFIRLDDVDEEGNIIKGTAQYTYLMIGYTNTKNVINAIKQCANRS